MAKNKQFQYDPEWARAKKLCCLSAEDIRMAKELGFKPRTLIKNNPSPQQQWKQPVKFWIRELYERKIRRPSGKRQRTALPAQSNVERPSAAPEQKPAPLLDEIPF